MYPCPVNQTPAKENTEASKNKKQQTRGHGSRDLRNPAAIREPASQAAMKVILFSVPPHSPNSAPALHSHTPFSYKRASLHPTQQNRRVCRNMHVFLGDLIQSFPQLYPLFVPFIHPVSFSRLCCTIQLSICRRCSGSFCLDHLRWRLRGLFVTV